MKKVIMGAVLGLMSVVAFAQTTPVAGQPHHTRAEAQTAREACKAQAGQPTDKHAFHAAMRQCMESKGFKHHERHPPMGAGQPGSNPVVPVVQQPAIVK